MDWMTWSRLVELERARWMAVRTARLRSRTLRRRIEDLEDEAGRLRLVVRALAEALRANGAVDEFQLSEALRRVDLEDGVEDGRLRRRPAEKPARPRRDAPRRRRRVGKHEGRRQPDGAGKRSE
jgi:hypothetical protein